MPNPDYMKDLKKGKISSGNKGETGFLDPKKAKIATERVRLERAEDEFKKRKPYDLEEGIENLDKKQAA